MKLFVWVSGHIYPVYDLSVSEKDTADDNLIGNEATVSTRRPCSLVNRLIDYRQTCLRHQIQSVSRNTIETLLLLIKSLLSRKPGISINVQFRLYLVNESCDHEAACTML